MVNDQLAVQIVDCDIEGAFKALDLQGHLSRSRSNGFASMIRRVRALATNRLVPDAG